MGLCLNRVWQSQALPIEKRMDALKTNCIVDLNESLRTRVDREMTAGTALKDCVRKQGRIVLLP